jgi:hypothetical protein
MFYCKPCELCCKTAECLDVPSSALPASSAPTVTAKTVNYAIWRTSTGEKSWDGPFTGNTAAAKRIAVEPDTGGGSRVLKTIAETPGERREANRLSEPVTAPASQVYIITWDWKDAPPLSLVRPALRSITAAGLTPHIQAAETGNDSYCWVIADRELTEEEATAAYEAWPGDGEL